MKHYRLRGAQSIQTPWLLFEVWFDLRDLRSGYSRSSAEHFRAMRGGWEDDEAFAWTRDMVQTVAPDLLEEIDPPRPLAWPSGSDARMIQYLVEFHRFPIWKNRLLEIYSRAGESRQEFEERCLQAVQPELNAQLRRAREIFMPRFSEAEAKWLAKARAEADIQESADRRQAQIREFFAGVHDRLGKWLAQDRLDHPPSPLWDEPAQVEEAILEQIEDLRGEFVQHIQRALDDCLKKAAQIESDEVGPQLSQIQIAERAILWD